MARIKNLTELIAKKDNDQSGSFIMIYGATEVGKTTTVIQTAACPIFWIATEPRNIGISIKAAKRDDLDIDYMEYQDFEDLIKFCSDADNFKRYKTVVCDGYTHLMNINLSLELTTERFDSLSDKEKDYKPLISKTKLSQEGYGGISGNMNRISQCFMRLAANNGKDIIVTCLEAQNPSWDKMKDYAPSLKGREFPEAMFGFFDLVGRVVTRRKGGKVVYPPMVYFETPKRAVDMGESWSVKYTGDIEGKRSGVLNLEKIAAGLKIGGYPPL